MGGEVTVTVESAAEFKEAKRHAEALGLGLKEWTFRGSWRSNGDDPVFLRAGSYEIEKVGREYFHLHIRTDNGEEVVPCKPAPHPEEDRRDGQLRLTFSSATIDAHCP